MSQEMLERLERIEMLIQDIETKLDNYLGVEDIDDQECKEVERLRKDVQEGNVVPLQDVFRD